MRIKSIFGKRSNENKECTAEFAPVLSVLPPEVAVTTGLEDDEVFSHRAKLYRFARECTPPEWKERGLGDIKITKTKSQVNFNDPGMTSIDLLSLLTKILTFLALSNYDAS